MFAYCNNDPVNYADESGSAPDRLNMVFIEDGSRGFGGNYCSGSMENLKEYRSELIGVFISSVITVAAGNVLFAEPELTVSDEQKVEYAVNTQRVDNPVVFPANPLLFTPLGLVPITKPGTKNGCFILWKDPITNTVVFRWDENINHDNGPHYHIIGDAHHYYANTLVPEPFASIYFPFD